MGADAKSDVYGYDGQSLRGTAVARESGLEGRDDVSKEEFESSFRNLLKLYRETKSVPEETLRKLCGLVTMDWEDAKESLLVMLWKLDARSKDYGYAQNIWETIIAEEKEREKVVAVLPRRFRVFGIRGRGSCLPADFLV